MPCAACGTPAMVYVRQYHMNKRYTYTRTNNSGWGMCFYYRR